MAHRWDACCVAGTVGLYYILPYNQSHLQQCIVMPSRKMYGMEPMFRRTELCLGIFVSLDHGSPFWDKEKHMA